MILKVITPPATEPIDLAAVQGQCRIADLSGEATTVNLFISAVRAKAEAITRRALITQTLELVLDCFPQYPGVIVLPRPPLQSVESIKYIDGDGNEQTMDSSLYLVDMDSEPARIVPAYGCVWPETQMRIATVRIRFVCGYGPISGSEDEGADNVPAAIKQWMTANVAALYETRESFVGASGRLTELDFTSNFDGLLDDLRVHGW